MCEEERGSVRREMAGSRFISPQPAQPLGLVCNGAWVPSDDVGELEELNCQPESIQKDGVDVNFMCGSASNI